MSDVPMNVLFQQAAALKTAQLAVDRTKYDSWDSWYQHSLFAKEDVREMRKSTSAVQKIGFARECKNAGSNYFRDAEYDAAINEYERCLSMLDWVEPTDPDWKKKGIQDKLLLEKTYNGEDAANPAEAAAEIRELKLACILNLSMCYWKSNSWAQCIRACDRALQLDPQSTKALYRRAQARIIPAYCGTVENMQALEDLKRAVAIKPDDTLLTTAYAELKISLSEQKKKDKKTFNNLFERKERATSSATNSSTDTLGGSQVDEPMIPAPAALSQRQNGHGGGSSYAGASSSSSAAPTSSSSSSAAKPKEEKKHLTWQDAFDMVRDMESAAERCDREGMPQQAAAMRKKKDELQKQMMIYFPKNVQSQLSEDTLEAAGAGVFPSDGVCSLAGPAGGKKKKKKAKAGTKAGAGDAAAAGVGGTAGLTGSPAAALSKVTTAAGGETPSSWYDVCGSTEYDLVDFSKPTPAMIKDAQSKGLDLTDVRVQQLMQEINRVRMRHAKEDAAKLKGKPAPKEDAAANSARMEAYMQEALRNIHAEEARRITATLLTDVSVRTQRKMLDTRLRFLELESDELEGEDDEDEGDEDERDASAGGNAVQSAQSKRNKLIASKVAALGDLGKVFETAVDPFACKKEVLVSTLRDMMIADIVDLRQVLEQEAQQARKLKAHQQKAAAKAEARDSPGARQRKGASAGAQKACGDAAGGADGAVVAQALAEAEERARLSLSEEIVDMLECKYGTAQHAGETASSLSGIAKSVALLGGLACVLLFCVNLVVRLLLAPGPRAGDRLDMSGTN